MRMFDLKWTVLRVEGILNVSRKYMHGQSCLNRRWGQILLSHKRAHAVFWYRSQEMSLLHTYTCAWIHVVATFAQQKAASLSTLMVFASCAKIMHLILPTAKQCVALHRAGRSGVIYKKLKECLLHSSNTQVDCGASQSICDELCITSKASHAYPSCRFHSHACLQKPVQRIAKKGIGKVWGLIPNKCKGWTCRGKRQKTNKCPSKSLIFTGLHMFDLWVFCHQSRACICKIYRHFLMMKMANAKWIYWKGVIS